MSCNWPISLRPRDQSHPIAQRIESALCGTEAFSLQNLCKKTYPWNHRSYIYACKLIYVCAAINLHLFIYFIYLLPEGGGGCIPFCEGGGTSVTVSPVAVLVKAYRFPFLQVGEQQVRQNSSWALKIFNTVGISVPDPWLFVLFRIQLFSSVASKTPTKSKFFFLICFAYYFLHLHQSSKIKSH